MNVILHALSHLVDHGLKDALEALIVDAFLQGKIHRIVFSRLPKKDQNGTGMSKRAKMKNPPPKIPGSGTRKSIKNMYSTFHPRRTHFELYIIFYNIALVEARETRALSMAISQHPLGECTALFRSNLWPQPERHIARSVLATNFKPSRRNMNKTHVEERNTTGTQRSP